MKFLAALVFIAVVAVIRSESTDVPDSVDVPESDDIDIPEVEDINILVAIDLPEDEVPNLEETTGDEVITEPAHPRFRRATCDILGHWVGSAACATHCIARRFRGGYCNSKQVCVCRR